MSKLIFSDIRYPGEYGITMLIHILGGVTWVVYFAVFFLIASTSIFWAVVSFIGFIGYFLVWPHLRFTAMIQGNGVLVSENQYPEIYKLTKDFFALFAMEEHRIPAIYIVQERGLNAFVVNAFTHNRIILLSDLVESLMDNENFEELRAVLGHELGHHLAKHPNFWLLDFPITFFPLSIFRCYQSRLAELTADRAGYFFSGSLKKTLQAYKKLIAGPKLGSIFNETAYEEQIAINKSSFLLRVASVFNTHPYFTKRVEALKEYDRRVTHG